MIRRAGGDAARQKLPGEPSFRWRLSRNPSPHLGLLVTDDLSPGLNGEHHPIDGIIVQDSIVTSNNALLIFAAATAH